MGIYLLVKSQVISFQVKSSNKQFCSEGKLVAGQITYFKWKYKM